MPDTEYVDLDGIDDYRGIKTGPLLNFPEIIPIGYKTISGDFEKWVIGPYVDLSGANLSGADLSGIILGPFVNSPKVLPSQYTFRDKYIVGQGINEIGTESEQDLIKGSVRVYEYSNNWTKLGETLPGSSYEVVASLDNCGNSILISSTEVDNYGSVNVYTYNGSEWLKITPTFHGFSTGDNAVTSSYLSSDGMFFQLGEGKTRETFIKHTRSLSNLSLANADLMGIDLRSIDLSGVVTGPLIEFPEKLPYGYYNIQGKQKWILGNYVNLTGIDMIGMNLSRVDLLGVKLAGLKTGPIQNGPNIIPDNYITLTGDKEMWIVGEGVHLKDANLSGMDLSGVNLYDVIFDNTKTGNLKHSTDMLSEGYVTVSGDYELWIIGKGTSLENGNMSGMDLSGIDLSGTTILNTKTGPLSNAPSVIADGYNVLQGDETWIIGPGALLTNIDMSGMDLSGIDLSGIDLTTAKLENAKLGPLVGSTDKLPSGYYTVAGDEIWIYGPGVVTTGSNITGAIFTNMGGLNLTGGQLVESNLVGVITGPLTGIPSSLPEGYFNVSGDYETWIIGPGVNLTGANMSGMDLSGIDMSGVIIKDTKTGPLVSSTDKLPDGNYTISGDVEIWIGGLGADLLDADMTGMDFEGKSMQGMRAGRLKHKPNSKPSTVDILEGNETWMIGPGMNMNGMNFDGVSLEGRDLRGSNLRGVNFKGLNLSNTDLNNSDLLGATLDKIQKIKGIPSVLPSSDSILTSDGHIIKTNDISSIGRSNGSLDINKLKKMKLTVLKSGDGIVGKLTGDDEFLFTDLENVGDYIDYESTTGNIVRITRKANDRFEVSGSETYTLPKGDSIEMDDLKIFVGSAGASTAVGNPTIQINMDICFTKETLIQTDQGKVKIININKTHTIQGKKIEYVTQTQLKYQKSLVKISKNAISENIPSQDTYMSMDHKVLVNHKLVPAKYLCMWNENVKFVKYRNQVLYNILMKDHEIIYANDMAVESLHPKNALALVYRYVKNTYGENNVPKKLIEACQYMEHQKEEDIVRILSRIS